MSNNDMTEDNIINTEVSNTNTEASNNDTEVSAEEIAEREQLYSEATDRINSLGLKWTFRSIEYIVNRENITFNQLRSCVFKNKGNEVKYDLEQAVKYIIASGLINPRTCTNEDYNECLAKAYDIMESWREEFGFIGILQILLINAMEKKHFFMGTQDVKILEHLASKNLQRDIVMNSIAVDMQTKIAQSQSLQS